MNILRALNRIINTLLGVTYFADGSRMDYLVRNDTIQYGDNGTPQQWLQIPIEGREGPPQFGVRLDVVNELEWERPLVRPLTESEKNDVRSKLIEFVRTQPKRFFIS